MITMTSKWCRPLNTFAVPALVILVAFAGTDGVAADHGGKKQLADSVQNDEKGRPTLWRDPADISARNLFYGPGGQEDQPHDTFTFVEEDLNGTNPKIVIQEQNGVKWTVKFGAEARPEVAASRLTWAIGYFANEDYFMHDLTVANVPARLRRARKYIAGDGSMHDVRLKRHLEGEKKTGTWPWSEDRFTGTRELNGLRVLMAVINNWDLTDENNAVYTIKKTAVSGSPEEIYMVSDVGSTFGSGRLSWPLRKGRGDLGAYTHSKFITKTTPDTVSFFTPTRPAFFYLFTPREFMSKLRLRWIGKGIPRSDAKWLGQQLGRLSPDQIRDAFRAADYSAGQIQGFTAIIQARIAALEEL
jgi:hypothetical protein